MLVCSYRNCYGDPVAARPFFLWFGPDSFVYAVDSSFKVVSLIISWLIIHPIYGYEFPLGFQGG
jgi:hypothetical protein